MAFYQSKFIPADEKDKAVIRYLDEAKDKDKTDRERYNFILNGNAFLHDILLGTDTEKKEGRNYYTRLKNLNEQFKLNKFSIRTKTMCLLKLQQEYINAAGIFGRPPLKTGTGEEEQNSEEEEYVKDTLVV